MLAIRSSHAATTISDVEDGLTSTIPRMPAHRPTPKDPKSIQPEFSSLIDKLFVSELLAAKADWGRSEFRV